MSSLFNAGVYAAASAITVFIVFFWRLPACSLYGLQAYLLPEDTPNGASDDPSTKQQQQPKKKKDKFVWNEGGSEILRITIGDSYLENIRYFPEYDQAVLYSALAVSLLASREYLALQQSDSEGKGGGDKVIPLMVIGFCILKLLHILLKVSWDKHSSRRTELALSYVVAFLGFMVSCIEAPEYVIDFGLGQAAVDAGFDKLPVIGRVPVQFLAAGVAAWLSGLLLGPAIKCVRCFWLGTNQLGWDLTVVKTSLWTRFLLNLNVVLPLVTALLWFKPMSSVFIREKGLFGAVGFSQSTFEDVRFVGLVLSGLTQLLLLRINVQSYLNLGVLAWYESLHGSKSPDKGALKKKILVVNHFMCRIAIQLLVPAVLIILFAGLSRAPACSETSAPRFVGQVSLFFSWWTLLSWSCLTCIVLTMFRFGLLLAY